MRKIDGARGEGGGQVLRTALALSLLRSEPVQVVDIRAGRKQPGLLRQHLAAVRLAAAVGDAEVEGAEAGSRELIFRPRTIVAGHHQIAVGTAGSTTLILQTVLPALLTAKAPSTLLLEGGTHNPLAPPFEFLARAWAPLIERMGPRVALTLERHGFHPAGGGRLRVAVQPVRALAPLELRERGEVRAQSGVALLSDLPAQIGRRELATLAARLGWRGEQVSTVALRGMGPGNTLSAVIESAHVTEVFTAFGLKALRAEAVGEAVAAEVRAYLDASAPVGPHLADQLILPLAMAGQGAFRTQPLTLHARTQLELVRELTGAPLRLREEAGTAQVEL